MDTRLFTEEQRGEFIEGWRAAGGYMGDLEESPAPWCCPWDYASHVDAAGTPYEMGAQYWEQTRGDVERELQREDEERELS